MQYAGTYGMGTPQQPPYGGATAYAVAAEPLPAPKPWRLHWSTYVFAGGMLVCFLALLATIAGIPASIGYDSDAPGHRDDPSSSDPLKMTRSMDANMRWMAEQSNAEPDHYVGLISSINRSEAAIPAIAQGMSSMATSVQAIDAKLREVYGTSKTMSADMTAMTAQSTASADKMSKLGTDVDALAQSMGELNAATNKLTQSMASIQSKADDIAKHGTSAALAATTAMNGTLPDGVPVPATDAAGGR